MKSTPTEKRRSSYLWIEQILAGMTLLGLICLGVGVPLFIIGKNSNSLTALVVGAYVLLTGVALVGIRVFYWILEEIVGRGLESMAKRVEYNRAL